MIRKKLSLILSILLLTSTLVACQSNASNETTNEVKANTNTYTEQVHKKNNTSLNEGGKATSTNSSSTGGDLKVYFLDVGQGDSIYIKTPKGDDILIDGGNNDKGDEVVQYLKNYGVDDIEVMIATHPDADHIGGLDTVLQNMKVKAVYMPKITHTTKTFEDFLIAVKNEGLKMKEAKAGKDLGLEGVQAKFVGPVKSYGDDLNTSSAVLKLQYGENRFLFTGDATIESEKDMLASGEDLRADVLKLGHHGASTSSSDIFLSSVLPQYGIISVGEGNRYGHPTEETLRKMKEHGITVERTDKQGTILAISDGKKITFKNEPSLLHKGSTSPVSVAPSKQADTPIPKKSTNNSTSERANLKASVDNQHPGQYDTIQLRVTGTNGVPYTAVFHYKSKDTIYNGTIGTPLPVKVSRASSGFEVLIDITAKVNGKEVQTKTSFVPQ